ncbi:MAG: 50S ribosomal protein L17 [Patescibacteria group bacterium]
MRHLVAGKRYDRDTKARKALFMNLVRSLIEKNQIETSLSRAKEIKKIAEKLITRAKIGDLASRRELHSFFGKRDVVNTLVEKVAPLFKDRNSGYLRLIKTGLRRGDNTQMASLSLVVKPEGEASLKSPKTLEKNDKQQTKVAKTAKKSQKKEAKETTKKSVAQVAVKSTVAGQQVAKAQVRAKRSSVNVKKGTR